MSLPIAQDLIAELQDYVSRGYASLTPEDLRRLKGWGLYEHRTKDGRFMLRVRIPSGFLRASQASILAQIAQDYGHGLIDITTRQAIQFHWLTLAELPSILTKLSSVGLNTLASCGDHLRSVTGNPLAGLDRDELLDTSRLVQEVEDYFYLNKDFVSLPRKFKVSISASFYNAGHAELNDLAFTPAVKILKGKEEKGFHVWVGGGLSFAPHLAKQLDLFILPEQVLSVVKGVVAIFRDYGNRDNRSKARLKYLIQDWGPEEFQARLLAVTGLLPARGQDKLQGWNAGFYTGLHPQKQEGLYYLGLAIPRGRLHALELAELTHLARKYGNGSLGTCNSQNILIANIPQERIGALLEENILHSLTSKAHTFSQRAICCTGKEFCGKAVVETKARLRKITAFLDKTLEVKVPLRLHMSGCASSCGQTQIADIGLQGTVTKTAQGVQEAFEFYIGGMLGPEAVFAQKLQGRVLAEHVHLVLLTMIRVYLKNRLAEESFHSCVKRLGLSSFQRSLTDFLKNQATDSVEEVFPLSLY